jgi:hypothetical protein
VTTRCVMYLKRIVCSCLVLLLNAAVAELRKELGLTAGGAGARARRISAWARFTDLGHGQGDGLESGDGLRAEAVPSRRASSSWRYNSATCCIGT